jgi:hypothetical protein
VAQCDKPSATKGTKAREGNRQDKAFVLLRVLRGSRFSGVELPPRGGAALDRAASKSISQYNTSSVTSRPLGRLPLRLLIFLHGLPLSFGYFLRSFSLLLSGSFGLALILSDAPVLSLAGQ